MGRPLLASGLAAMALAGCGSRCPEIAAAKRALIERTAIAPGPHVQVRIPLERANAFIAELLGAEPLAVPLELPGLGPLALPAHELTAIAREVRLRPARPGSVRFAVRIEIADAGEPWTTLAIETEVKPAVARAGGVTELVAGFGPDNLVAVTPVLGPDAERTLGDAIARRLPPAVRDRLPRSVVERGARDLATYLTGAAYKALQNTLLHRLGEVTRLRVRLPDVPIASTALRSSSAPAEALTIDIATDLPVRAGLAGTEYGLRAATDPTGDEVTVRISSSTATELANWAIDRGHLPQHYTRGLEPRPDGEFRPRFDYLAGDPVRPVKIHVFQDRGGCSYFQVGLRLELRIVDDKLEVATLDQFVEAANASRVVEVGLWLKQLVQGSIDRSRRAAAHTQLAIGGRAFQARAVSAAVVGDDLAFELRLASAAPRAVATPVVR
jgi:hypothetical protein